MFDPVLLFLVLCVYMGMLFLVALITERSALTGRNLSNNPVVYSLSLAVYCTAWTYYGSVGKAANSGMLYLTIYIGPTLAILFWGTILRRMVRIKNSHHVTSIADFISLRYNKSQAVAALVTIIAVVGIAPYIALQLKAIFSTFELLTRPNGSDPSWMGRNVGPMLVLLMIVFTIVFGVRRVDPTERHQGLVMAVAVECLVKLLAFLAVGVFVTYVLYDGFGDILESFSASMLNEYMLVGQGGTAPYSTWISYLLLSMSAILFLPRQFHVTVVENFEEHHIRTAMWFFPLYMLVISLFVVPIAMAGLLEGFPVQEADTFVLRLPLSSGVLWLSLLVFVGGFSAATAMLIVSSITLSTMVTNHLLMPLLQVNQGLGFLRRYLLQCRWAAVALIILTGYLFERAVEESYLLVSIGMISFVAVLQFAPAIIGGIFWRRGNKAGALMGMSGGFLVWLHTLFVPTLVKSGWLSEALLEAGPGGVKLLAPECLFGLSAFDPITHSVFWTMVFNIGLYVLGSFLFVKGEQEERLTDELLAPFERDIIPSAIPGGVSNIDTAAKQTGFVEIFEQYFPPVRAREMVDRCVKKAGLDSKDKITITQLAELNSTVERLLAGSIGAAAAHTAMKQAAVFDVDESKRLSLVYGEMLASLRVSPEELKSKLDYYKEREALLNSHARELEELVEKRTAELKLANEQITRQQERLVLTARESGMMEMASGIIHNIGNAINTIGLRMESISELPQRGFIDPAVFLKDNMVSLLESHLAQRDIEEFLLHDEKGRKILPAFTQVLDKFEQLGGKLSEDYNFINHQVVHISEIIALQQNFVGSLGTEEFVNVNPIILDSLRIWKDSLKKRNIETDLQLEAKAHILADKTQLAQVFINFIKNSIEAIDEKQEEMGSITFTTNDIDYRGVPGIEIITRDNGCGIPEDTMKKIFDFGISSKRDKKVGQGFGLFFCRKIIEKYSGTIEVRSQVNEFSEFKIIFQKARREGVR